MRIRHIFDHANGEMKPVASVAVDDGTFAVAVFNPEDQHFVKSTGVDLLIERLMMLPNYMPSHSQIEKRRIVRDDEQVRLIDEIKITVFDLLEEERAYIRNKKLREFATKQAIAAYNKQIEMVAKELNATHSEKLLKALG